MSTGIHKHINLLLFLLMFIQPTKLEIILFPGSRKSEIKQFEVDGMTIDSLFHNLQTLVYHDPDSARLMALKGIKIAHEHKQSDWEIRLLNLVGASHAIESEYLKALEYYHRALEVAQQSGNLERSGDTYNNIGGINYFARNYTEAIANYLEALNYYEKNKAYDKIAGVHCNIGILYASLDNPAKAMYHYNAGLVGFKKLHLLPGQTVVLSHMARNYLNDNKYDSAIILINEAIDLSRDIHELYSLSISLKTKGDIYLALGHFDDALMLFNQSETEALKINNKSTLGTIYIGFATVYLEIGELIKAKKYTVNALEFAVDVNDEQMIVDAHFMLSKIYEKAGDFQKSLQHYQTAAELKNRILNESKLHSIYHKEIQHLSKDKEIQRLEIERQQYLINQRNNTIFIIILVSLVIIIIVAALYYYYANKVRTDQQKKINEANLKATEERSKVALDAEIQERKQIGLELHDRVGPLLSLAKLNITALADHSTNGNGTKQKMLGNTLETINEILREIKQISQNMAPVVLIEKGFEAAIRNLVVRMNETKNHRVSLDMFGINGKLEPYVEHVLYRSILESINNILRHANGTEINIQIIGSKDDITVMIEDNGQGFDPNDLVQSKGLGMKSTRNRIESLKGNMFIDSKIGMGTIVTFIVPLIKEIKA